MMNVAHVEPLAVRAPRGQSVVDADVPGHGRSSSLSPGLYIRAASQPMQNSELRMKNWPADGGVTANHNAYQ